MYDLLHGPKEFANSTLVAELVVSATAPAITIYSYYIITRSVGSLPGIYGSLQCNTEQQRGERW